MTTTKQTRKMEKTNWINLDDHQTNKHEGLSEVERFKCEWKRGQEQKMKSKCLSISEMWQHIHFDILIQQIKKETNIACRILFRFPAFSALTTPESEPKQIHPCDATKFDRFPNVHHLFSIENFCFPLEMRPKSPIQNQTRTNLPCVAISLTV